jgi:hypothetical protein
VNLTRDQTAVTQVDRRDTLAFGRIHLRYTSPPVVVVVVSGNLWGKMKDGVWWYCYSVLVFRSLEGRW